MSDSPSLSAGGSFLLTDSGIEIAGEPSLAGRVAAVCAAKAMARAAPLALAELYRYGQSREDWSEEFSQVMAGYDRRTIENMASLVRKVSPEVRAAAPSIGHADAVRSLPAERQKALMDEATAGQLSVAEVRRRARRERKLPLAQGHASRDAESLQMLVRALQRSIDDVQRVSLELDGKEGRDACRAVMLRLEKSWKTLDEAARLVLAETVGPKGETDDV